MSTEYFTEIDKIPRRTNAIQLKRMLLSFLESNIDKAKVNADMFGRNPKFLSNSINRYARKHSLEVTSHCISNEVYLEKLS